MTHGTSPFPLHLGHRDEGECGSSGGRVLTAPRFAPCKVPPQRQWHRGSFASSQFCAARRERARRLSVIIVSSSVFPVSSPGRPVKLSDESPNPGPAS